MTSDGSDSKNAARSFVRTNLARARKLLAGRTGQGGRQHNIYDAIGVACEVVRRAQDKPNVLRALSGHTRVEHYDNEQIVRTAVKEIFPSLTKASRSDYQKVLRAALSKDLDCKELVNRLKEKGGIGGFVKKTTRQKHPPRIADFVKEYDGPTLRADFSESDSKELLEGRTFALLLGKKSSKGGVRLYRVSTNRSVVARIVDRPKPRK